MDKTGAAAKAIKDARIEFGRGISCCVRLAESNISLLSGDLQRVADGIKGDTTWTPMLGILPPPIASERRGAAEEPAEPAGEDDEHGEEAAEPAEPAVKDDNLESPRSKEVIAHNTNLKLSLERQFDKKELPEKESVGS